LDLISNMKYIPKKEQTIPQKIDAKDFIDNFQNLVGEYFKLKPSGIRGLQIMSKRFGLAGGKEYTLDEIGRFHGVSRERIRQIESRYVGIFSTLLSQGRRRKIICDPILFKQVNKLSRLLNKYEILSQDELNLLLAQKLHYALKKDKEKYFMFLLRLLGFEQDQILEQTIFVRVKKINVKRFKVVCNEVISVLSEKVDWISEFDLSVAVKRRFRDVHNSYVQHAIGILIQSEKVQKRKLNGELMFQIYFYGLKSLSDCAYRILIEKGKKLHVNEILSEIRRRRIIAKIKKLAQDRSLRGELVSDNRMVAIGHSGFWALKEWNLNTDTIIEIIKNVIYGANNPCTLSYIIRRTLQERSDANEYSIKTYLKDERLFLRLRRGKYIVKEWERRFQGEILRIKKYRVFRKNGKMAQIKEYIEKILNTNQEKMPLLEIMKSAVKRFSCHKNTVYQIVSENSDVWKKIVDQNNDVVIISLKKHNEVSSYLIENNRLDKLLKSGETDVAEWKSSLRWDYLENKLNTELEYVVAKEIAAFLNTKGGTLIIGVDDESRVLGLSKDFGTLRKQNQDGFRLKLAEVIDNCIGKTFHSFISVSFEKHGGINDVCLVDVSRSARPAFIRKSGEEQFYVRAQSSSKPLKISEAMEYIRHNWK